MIATRADVGCARMARSVAADLTADQPLVGGLDRLVGGGVERLDDIARVDDADAELEFGQIDGDPLSLSVDRARKCRGLDGKLRHGGQSEGTFGGDG